MAKRTPESDRRRLIEEQRKKARAAERRTTILVIAACSVVALMIIGGAVYYTIQEGKKPSNTAMRSVGVPATAAACTAPESEDTKGGADHVTTQVTYEKIPPTSGKHDPTPLPFGKRFYSRSENPKPEKAVHNLEHAYVVVWYDSKVTDAQVEKLREAADGAEGKFIVVPWTRGDFTGDKHIVLTAWGERQACSDVSGEVMQQFQDDFGGNAGKAPEKGAI